MLRTRVTTTLCGASLLLASCGGGGSDSSTPNPPTPTPTPLYSVPAQEALSTSDVEKILAQAIEEAAARGKPATIAIVDRVGNVLAVYAMAGAPTDLLIKSPPDGRTVAQTDIEDRLFPNAIAAGAIAKAVTGAYLSSGGNAFSTRTASDIVQEHFPVSPGTIGLESGPLFGVQFSQLPCSDFSSRFTGTASGNAFIGPKRSPLGLAADPGGIPLYKNGVLVGGIGVMSDSLYSYDPDYQDIDSDPDELIALAASAGFAVPGPLISGRYTRISVDGTLLKFSDALPQDLRFSGTPRTFAALNVPAIGSLIAVTGYSAATIVAGRAYGSEASGIRKATTAEFNNADAFVFSDGSGGTRYPIRAATDAGDVAQPLTATEVRAVLEEAFLIMGKARAQIRKPDDSRAQVSLSVVDTRGVILGIVRSPDAPIFGSDVAVQKARTAAFFSNAQAGSDLLAEPGPISPAVAPNVTDARGYVSAARTFLNDPSALTGKVAVSDRWFGLLTRPYFPDGEVGKPNGPFSQPIGNFSPFSTGLQTALIFTNLAQHVQFVTGASTTDTRQRCTFLPDHGPSQNRLQNGIQIFPGGVPIYRGNVLIGAIGISGDGIDQDDMISFLGLHNAGLRIGGIGHPLPAARASQIAFPATRGGFLPYVQCPFAPFLGSQQQNVCEGK